ncbi:GNAT family N-acetyltransferase [Roseateles sp.]|jgi:ribosomal protein S18 acetylase RimI-like enzyme|uniref:GNAT family N-acetyltransferase n=1 Tax=Roseateles sp. TaxID=1971397 RepID=UPI0037CBF09E
MLSYRSAVTSDLPALCALGEQVNAIHHAAHPQVFAAAGAPDRDEEHWAACLGRDDARIFVAELDGQLVGFVTVVLVNEAHSLLQPMRFGRVGSVSVTEAMRGRGIGKELMRQAHAFVAELGGHEVRLTVWAFNEAALRLYQELGYETRSLNLARRADGDR